MITKSDCTKGALMAFASALAPALALAAPSTMLEKSATYALDNQYRSYRVPTTDSTGKIKYYDVTVKLTVGPTGAIASSAIVTSTLSPNIASMTIAPGAYKGIDDTTCIARNTTLINGRTQSSLTCTKTSASRGLVVATGPVSDGHPFLANLVALGIPTLPEVDSKNWGITTGSGVFPGCGTASSSIDAVGTVSNGASIDVSVYRSKTIVCSFTLVKT